VGEQNRIVKKYIEVSASETVRRADFRKFAATKPSSGIKQMT
jgi:hypothetical protein